MDKGTYTAAFPLHDGSFDEDGPDEIKSARRVNDVSMNDKDYLVFQSYVAKAG